jgi:predicted phosphoribosyltransferase
MPEDFAAVGAFYEDFRQVDDGTVISLLQKANENVHGAYSAR